MLGELLYSWAETELLGSEVEGSNMVGGEEKDHSLREEIELEGVPPVWLIGGHFRVLGDLGLLVEVTM